MDFSTQQRRFLLDLARAVIRRELGGNAVQPTAPEDPALEVKAGCFVTLHTLERHRLRGCIGQLTGDGPLARTLEEMSQAVLHDSRFAEDPVTLPELPELELELTILSPLELAAHPQDFDLLQHGIYLQHEGRAGCFLPQVARETGWDRETLLAQLCTQKMGLPPSAWRDPAARLMRFAAMVIGPEPAA